MLRELQTAFHWLPSNGPSLFQDAIQNTHALRLILKKKKNKLILSCHLLPREKGLQLLAHAQGRETHA